jgi:uncharacterized protein YjiS (DUF1127 family)
MTTIDIGRPTSVAPEGRSFGLLAWVPRMLQRMAARRRERLTLMALSQLDTHLMRDIGLQPHHLYEALDGRRNLADLFDPED